MNLFSLISILFSNIQTIKSPSSNLIFSQFYLKIGWWPSIGIPLNHGKSNARILTQQSGEWAKHRYRGTFSSKVLVITWWDRLKLASHLEKNFLPFSSAISDFASRIRVSTVQLPPDEPSKYLFTVSLKQYLARCKRDVFKKMKRDER